MVRELLFSVRLFMALTLCAWAACATASNGAKKGSTPVPAKGYAALSAESYPVDARYYYDVYNAAAKANGEPAVFRDSDIVVHPLTYDQLAYLLQQKGNFLILFGGPWSKEVRTALPYINEYAKAYGIDAVYNFDFRLDGESKATDVENLTDTTRNPYGKTVAASEYNYLYGEIVERYLTNLDEWTRQTSTSEQHVRWRHVDGKTYSDVARLAAPFLFIYNRDSLAHPIRFAFEGASDNYKKDLKTVFHYAFQNKLHFATYTDGDYYADALIENNNRGHAPKLYDIFTKGEPINLNNITYSQLRWLLGQNGESVVLIAGPWCANSTAAFGPINDYAVANHVQVYVFDDRLDGKHPIDFWGYGRDRQFKSRDWSVPGKEGELNPNAYLYVDLVRQQLPNMEVTRNEQPIFYLDQNGDTVKAPASQSPYLFDYNKAGYPDQKHPIITWFEKMLEVNEANLRPELYLYTPENYKAYTDGIKKVLASYALRTGGTSPLSPKKPRHHLVDFNYIEVPPKRQGFGPKEKAPALDKGTANPFEQDQSCPL